MQRRDFLIRSLGGALTTGTLTTGALTTGSRAADVPPPAIIDTHTHFYDPTRSQGVPWPPKDNAALYRRFLPETFRQLAEPHGVVGTVVVEASPWVEDNQWLLDLADQDSYLVGVVGRLDPASDDFDQHLRRFARHPRYRGIRIAHAALTAGLNGKLVQRCRRLVDHDLQLDVNGGPDMPAQVATLARAVPELRIVINHCANVRIDGNQPPQAWRDAMATAARHTNVYCKVSALPAADTAEPYLPVLDALWTLFGEDRLIFGSNWPVSNRGDDFGRVLAIVRGYFLEKGRPAAEKVFHANAQAAYRWKTP